MKKAIAILLSVLFCVLFTACAQKEDGSHNGPESQSVSATAGDGEKPSLTVLCDFPNQNPGGYIGEALLGIPGMDDYELLMEYVPDKEPERSNYITRTNVELMSGKGADVFIADCYMGNLLTDVEGPLFNYPEKLMENHIFLPLDEYIEKAQFTDFDRLLPVVMEAGKNGEGQQILPLTYIITATSAQKEVYSLPDPLPGTREEMLASENQLLDYMARPQSDNLLMYLGNPADFVEEELSFTEDELFDLAMGRFELAQTSRAGGYESVGSGWENGVQRYVGCCLNSHVLSAPSVDDQLIVVPGPNRTGGITAAVESYGAVNRNTKQPEMAFAVLDKLLSQSNQQNNEMFFLLSGMPVDTELGGADSRFMWANSWFMNDWNLEQYKAVRDRIDSVKFYTPLDREAENILLEACEAEDATEDSIRRAVHK